MNSRYLVIGFAVILVTSAAAWFVITTTKTDHTIDLETHLSEVKIRHQQLPPAIASDQRARVQKALIEYIARHPADQHIMHRFHDAARQGYLDEFVTITEILLSIDHDLSQKIMGQFLLSGAASHQWQFFEQYQQTCAALEQHTDKRCY